MAVEVRKQGRIHAPFELRKILYERLVRPATARALHEETIERLQTSIAEFGMLQPPVVLELDDDEYELCAGAHRIEADKRNGATAGLVFVLPRGTPPEVALACSTHENHVRHDESLPDVMRRVTALMKYHGCTKLSEGCALAGLHKSTISKFSKVLSKMSPEALAVIAEHKIGIGVAYEIARHAPDGTAQKRWLLAHVEGELPRDGIAAEAKREKASARSLAKRKTTATPTPKPLRLRTTLDGVAVAATCVADADPQRVARAIVVVARAIVAHVQDGRPLAEFTLHDPVGSE